MSAMTRTFNAAFAALEGTCTAIAAASYMGITSVVFVDVIGRYVFNMPLQISHTLITNFLIVSAFFLSLSYSERVKSHITVDILYASLPKEARKYLFVFNKLLTIIVAGLICYGGFKEALYAYNNSLVEYNIIPWPMWVSYAFIPIGMSTYIIRVFVDMFSMNIEHAASH